MCFQNPNINYLPSRQELTRDGLISDCESTETIDIWETVESDPYAQVKAIELECTGRNTLVAVAEGNVQTVGRDGELATDNKMSRRHFTIRCNENHGVLCDLASTNGTLVNGIKVDEATVYDGDQITAGSTSFTVRFVIDA